MTPSKITRDFGSNGTIAHITPDIDFTKEIHISVETAPGYPIPFSQFIFGEGGLVDLRFHPFTLPTRGRAYVRKEGINETVKVTRAFLTEDGFRGATEALIEFYSKNLEMVYNADFSSELIEMTSEGYDPTDSTAQPTDLMYYINTWLAIIDHFGFDAPYAPVFIQQMYPAFRLIEYFGFCDPTKTGKPDIELVRTVHGKEYQFHEFMSEMKYLRNRYCSFIKNI